MVPALASRYSPVAGCTLEHAAVAAAPEAFKVNGVPDAGWLLVDVLSDWLLVMPVVPGGESFVSPKDFSLAPNAQKSEFVRSSFLTLVTPVSPSPEASCLVAARIVFLVAFSMSLMSFFTFSRPDACTMLSKKVSFSC